MKDFLIKNKIPELLAPVGGWAHLVAAVNNGADAVYMGGNAFNARIFADNFSDEDLEKAIDYAHEHDVKVYITLNTLIKDDELVRAFEYANKLYQIGADALIVQDMGLVRLIRKYLPDFPIHLSTQGSVYNIHAIDSVESLGVSRIVPARELNIDEISNFTKAAHAKNIEVEIFVHGALCMCYSGQCQMSRGLSTKGNSRSGNRGTCAQPCRLAYTNDSGQTSYWLSPKDLCYLKYLPELIKAGVDSFKIEGRMKSPEYVAIVTRIYRKYIDKALDTFSIDKKDIDSLKRIFNRGGFSDGYLHGNPCSNLLSGKSPKNQGIYIGKVVAVIDSESKVQDKDEKSAVRGALQRGKNLVTLQITDENISNGDVLEFRNESSIIDDDSISNVVTYIKKLDSDLYILGDFDKGTNIGDSVYKVSDKEFQTAALNTSEKKLPVSFLFTARIGQYISLTMTDIKSGCSVEIFGDHIIEKARKVATDKERIVQQLCRLGDTVFKADWTSCDIELDDNAMVPVSQINRLRREAVSILLEKRINKIKASRKELSKKDILNIVDSEHLGSECLNIKEYAQKFNSNQLKLVPIDKFIQSREKDGLPYILNISKGYLDNFIESNFDEIVDATRKTGILIGNLGWIKRFLDAGITVYSDYGLNIFNHQSELAYSELGLQAFAVSHETGLHDSRGLPLMITEHPIESDYLIDRKGALHKIIKMNDKFLIY